MKKIGWISAGCVVVLVGVSLLPGSRGAAQAAARALLVKNVDERGRGPYQSMVTQTCQGFPCVLTFDRVPVGKRLVVEYVTGLLNGYEAAGGTLPRAELIPNCRLLSGCPSGAGMPLGFQRNYENASEMNRMYIVRERLLAYVEEGALPGVFLYPGSSAPGVVLARFYVVGYLIDKDN